MNQLLLISDDVLLIISSKGNSNDTAWYTIVTEWVRVWKNHSDSFETNFHITNQLATAP